MPSYKLHITADLWSQRELSSEDLEAINDCLMEILQHGGSLAEELPYFVEDMGEVSINRLTATQIK